MVRNFLLTLFFCFITTSVYAHKLGYGPYVKMQEALASDDFKSSLAAHKFICEKELIHYTEDYRDCKKAFKGIDELRESFKELSEVYIENGKKEEMKGLIVATCPMAKAKWIQKEGSIKNPYYGSSMLGCGSKI